MNIKTSISALLLIGSCAIPTFANTLTVNFDGITKSPGTIYVVMFDSEEAYSNSGKPAFTRRIEVNSDTASISIKDVSKGTYAIKSFLDSNGNKQMDTNIVGLPVEQYGFSNNAGRFGPPSFEDAAFEVLGEHSISIRLR